MLLALERLGKVFDQVNQWTGRLISWLTLLMVLVTFVIVVLRYAFSLGWIAMQESVIYMHTLVFMLGGAYTLLHQGHVRVDIFYREMRPVRRAWVDLLGTLFFLLPMFGFILWSSWDYVASSWELKEASREAGGLPWVYLLKSSMLLMGVLLVLQGLADIIRNLLVILGLRHHELLQEHIDAP